MFLFPREIANYHCMLSHLFLTCYLTNFRVLRSATFFKTPSREISGMEKLSGKFTSMHDFIKESKRETRETAEADIVGRHQIRVNTSLDSSLLSFLRFLSKRFQTISLLSLDFLQFTLFLFCYDMSLSLIR